MITIDKATIKRIDEAIVKAVQGVANDFGIAITHQKSLYGPSNAKVTLEIAVINSKGEVVSKEVEDFKLNAQWYGLKATDLGRRFAWHDGFKYEIVGLMPRRTKYPVVAVRVGTERRTLFAVSAVVGALK